MMDTIALVAALNWLAIFRLHESLRRLRWKLFRQRLLFQSSGDPLKDRWHHAAVASRLFSLTSRMDAQGHNKRKPRLFITGEGMAAYIQWWCIPERSHRIHKVVYNIKSGSIPDPMLPFTANILKYYANLARRP